MANKAIIGGNGHDILAIVAALELRLADTEHQRMAYKLRNATLEIEKATGLAAAGQTHQAAAAPSYADCLKLPKGKAPVAMPAHQGAAVVFFPNSETITSSEPEARRPEGRAPKHSPA